MPFLAAHPSLLRALAERGYTEPTPVQAAMLSAPTTSDLLVSAQTGSGKTVAFGLAMAPTLLSDVEKFSGPATPRALIIAPTRELALQVTRELEWLYGKTGARVVACVGGMDPRFQERGLRHGAHLVVGTPGRLCDHVDRGALKLADVQVVVLDEADEMLDMGFRDDLMKLLGAAPKERRTLLFSATIPPAITRLAKEYQRDALRISTVDEREAHADIEYRAVLVPPRQREAGIVNVLRWVDANGALVFCATREGAANLCARLVERGFAAVSLSGENSQNERNRALQALRDGRARVCVATDVAARGLDLPDLGLVIHADLPRDRQALLHRSGRTGRAGKKGTCVLIVPAPARQSVNSILRAAGIEAQWSPPPTPEQIAERDHARIVRELSELVGEAAPADLAVANELLASRTAPELVAAFVRLHRGRSPAVETIEQASEPPRFSGPPRGPRKLRPPHRR